MPETRIDNGVVFFQAEGRLLQELGERLVASPEVALVELIKNAYDADSPLCSVSLEDSGKSLVVQDLGNGMTDADFKSKWMRIATDNKIEVRQSKKYKRKLTGQKGIGRFAVRFLGRTLHLDTVAWDEERKHKTRLIAEFDWEKIDEEKDLNKAQISYQLFKVDEGITTGTTLKIQRLKIDKGFIDSSKFHTAVMKIVTPLNGLDWGRFNQTASYKNGDPGFSVDLPGSSGEYQKQLDVAKYILDRAWARLTIDFNKGKIIYKVTFGGENAARELSVDFESNITNGLFADIRFFPRRKGVFSQMDEMDVDGRLAWSWVRENQGVGIVDHGFRVKPYGFGDDDWLILDRDKAHSERKWKTKIAEDYFPMTAGEKIHPIENPMLNLPSNFQLVGAVFVESKGKTGTGNNEDLIPSMDREGFIDNDSFKELFEIVRGGIEFLASKDKKRLQRLDEKRSEEAEAKVRYDLKLAIEHIKESQTLTRADKTRIVEEYSNLAKHVDEVEQYDKEARRKLETMSLLGVVAGFMTHEASRIIEVLQDAIEKLKAISKQHPSLGEKVTELEKSYETFSSYVNYTKTFIGTAQENISSRFKADAQVRKVIKQFGGFAEENKIKIKCEVKDDTEVPAMPVTIYSGILLNLYTNALKAILASKTHIDNPTILFRIWNEEKDHIVEVHDTGIGIPPSLRKRIWDPGFTTTSQLNNPLGTGMGLGLSLIKELVTQLGGAVNVIDPAEGFNTCFRVVFRGDKRK